MSAATMTPGMSVGSMPVGGELRLTRRGRRVLRMAGVLLVGAALLTGGRAVADAPGAAVTVDSYTVGSGETLWSIATAFTGPGDDVRDTMDHLADLNGMAGSGLVAGQQILVPAAG
jgi:hypothetical protein